MTRLVKPLICCMSLLAATVLASGCGSQGVSVSTTSSVHSGAILFSQRCAGCHTLSVAGAHGSAANVRTAQYNNGPNFDVRCERPVARVLFAIENGGFSGAIMPQNIVVGQDAAAVAKFVSQYAGITAPKIPGTVQCKNKPIGTLPGATAQNGSSAASPAASAGSKRSYAAASRSKRPGKKKHA